MARIIDRASVEQLYDCMECIHMMEEVQKQVSDQKCSMLDRGLIPFSNGNSLAVMPAGMEEMGITGAKLAIFAGPETKKKKTQQGIIPLFDTTTGQLLAVVEAELITVIRTAAVSAMATDCLAGAAASVLAVLGAGRLAYMHILFISRIRPLSRICLYSRDLEKAGRLAGLIREALSVETVVCPTAEEAVRSADIICTVTNAKEPVLKGSWIKPGAHINAVGACKSTVREIDTETLRACRIFVDSRKAALADAGDLLIPIRHKEISESDITGEIGEVLSGVVSGRQSDEERTLFESVGLPVQDLIMAYRIYQKACEKKWGCEIPL